MGLKGFAARIAVAAAVMVAAGTQVSAQGGPAAVITERVERREVSETVPVFAQVVATSDSDLAVRVSGAVVMVPVDTGSIVAAGDTIAELDRELLEIELSSADAALGEARAGVEVARADVTVAARAFDRIDGLRGTSAFSQGRFEDAEGALARARGELSRAEAGVVAAQAAQARAAYELARATVRAPFDATVLEVLVDPGEYLQPGTAVARLLDVGTLEVEANVPAQFVGSLSPGLTLSGQTDTGEPLTLTVRAVLPTEFSTTRTRPVRFSPEDASGIGLAAVGQSLTVDVPRSAPREVVLVPKDALSQSRGAWNAYVNADGTAEPREVLIGASFGRFFEVLGGLAPGDEVVVRGNERLRPMQAIAPTLAEPQGGPNVPAAAADAPSAQPEDRGGAERPAATAARQAAVIDQQQ